MDTSYCAYLCQDRLAQLHSFSFLRLKTDDLVVDFLIENNSVNVVKQAEQMSLRDNLDLNITLTIIKQKKQQQYTRR